MVYDQQVFIQRIRLNALCDKGKLETCLDGLFLIGEFWIAKGCARLGSDLCKAVCVKANAMAKDTRNWKRRQRCKRILRRAEDRMLVFVRAECRPELENSCA